MTRESFEEALQRMELELITLGELAATSIHVLARLARMSEALRSRYPGLALRLGLRRRGRDEGPTHRR